MIKLLVSDIDGTLMNRNKEIDRRDIEAVRAAVRQGTRLCLASGRLQSEIEAVRERLNIPCFAICQNGATVVSEEGGLLAESVYDARLALDVLFRVCEPGLVAVVCTADGNAVQRIDAEAARVGNRFLSPLREEPKMREAIRNGLKVTKFSVYGEVGRLERLLHELGEAFGGAVAASFSDPDGVDIMPGGVDKGAGVRLLMETLAIGPDEVACIGDSFNDLAMFDACGIRFAMSHAAEHVRSRAGRVADSVADAIGSLELGPGTRAAGSGSVD